ncbi:MAG TPA: membrane protein insertion efficiency factor YidD [Acidobacteriaceae bacterium]|nr:membrane protein insertion efficiency factor YidD [Acidobacteriaceae bacterium]
MKTSPMQQLRRVRSTAARAWLALYKQAVSPSLHAIAPGACRFQPTCSEYAAIAVAEHGMLRGGLMALGRLLRCHPLSRGGFDPVPAKDSASHIHPTSSAISCVPQTDR